MSTTKNSWIANEIRVLLKGTPEQQTVVGPLVQHLLTLGWTLDQMVFGKKEWRIPKSPSEAKRREKAIVMQDSRLTLPCLIAQGLVEIRRISFS